MAAEAETAAIFHNAQQAVPIRIILQALDHEQPPTPVKTDNSTAQGFIQDNIHMKKSKSWDMRYHWLRDCQTQNQFQFYWKPSKDNNADYFTKHHAATHHRQIRNQYVHGRLNFLSQRIQKIHRQLHPQHSGIFANKH